MGTRVPLKAEVFWKHKENPTLRPRSSCPLKGSWFHGPHSEGSGISLALQLSCPRLPEGWGRPASQVGVCLGKLPRWLGAHCPCVQGAGGSRAVDRGAEGGEGRCSRSAPLSSHQNGVQPCGTSGLGERGWDLHLPSGGTAPAVGQGAPQASCPSHLWAPAAPGPPLLQRVEAHLPPLPSGVLGQSRGRQAQCQPGTAGHPPSPPSEALVCSTSPHPPATCVEGTGTPSGSLHTHLSRLLSAARLWVCG